MHQHRRAGGGREVAGEGGDELVDAARRVWLKELR
jgi:hypothetical protein